MSGARPISKAEHTEVVNTFNNLRNKCLYILGRNTGFRISELLSITIGDVKDKDYVKVTRANVKGKTSSREVILNAEAKNAINEYLNSFDCSNLNGPLFVSREGINKPITRFMAHKILRDAFTEAKLSGSLSTHSMRKSYALNVYVKSGYDLLLTQRALGHSSIITTVKYLPTDQEKLNKIILDT